jgi:biotin carboxylase
LKKLLMLGGSAAQVNAIKHAKKLGLHVILCDYLPDNPGQFYADEYIPASTTDEKIILQISEKKKIDGIVAYASDPAAPTAAFVGNHLGLPSNPYESVVTLCQKDLFRDFLRKKGFETPDSSSFTSLDDAYEYFLALGSKGVVKPVDSSGSKGVSILSGKSDFRAAFDRALHFSRCKRVIVEEKLENRYPHIMGGDGFIVGGVMKFSCLMNCQRDTQCNPLVPVGKSAPSIFLPSEKEEAEKSINKALSLLNMKMGALNLEAMVDTEGKIFILEIGPRNGGNLIPEQIKFLTGVDMVDLTLKSAMGMDLGNVQQVEPKGYFASHVIHSRQTGTLSELSFSQWLEERIFYRLLYKKPGDPVERFEGANQAIGIVMMRFASEGEMHETLDTIYDRHIKLGVEG